MAARTQRTLKKGERVRLTRAANRKHQPMVEGRVLAVDDHAVRIEVTQESTGVPEMVKGTGRWEYRPWFQRVDQVQVIPWGRVALVEIVRELDLDAVLGEPVAAGKGSK